MRFGTPKACSHPILEASNASRIESCNVFHALSLSCNSRRDLVGAGIPVPPWTAGNVLGLGHYDIQAASIGLPLLSGAVAELFDCARDPRLARPSFSSSPKEVVRDGMQHDGIQISAMALSLAGKNSTKGQGEPQDLRILDCLVCLMAGLELLGWCNTSTVEEKYTMTSCQSINVSPCFPAILHV